jgi:hypothetical protein
LREALGATGYGGDVDLGQLFERQALEILRRLIGRLIASAPRRCRRRQEQKADNKDRGAPAQLWVDGK